jgi:uncharacterized membrane protein HdeD (DUF308 family)
MTSQTTTPAPSRASRSFWFLGVGIALILLGALGLGATAIFEVTSVLLLGPLLMANSICQLLLMVFTGPLRSRIFHFSSALLSLVVGFLVMSNADEAGADLALLLTAFLLVAGLNRIFGSLEADLPARGWLVATGAFALALGFAVWARAPTRGFWLISICVALDFLCHGVTWVWFSMLVLGKVESPIPESEEIHVPTTGPAQLQH